MTANQILDFTGIRYLWRIIGRASSETFSTKAELDEVKASADSAFHWRGSVSSEADLPADAAIGDVWNVGESLDGFDCVWTGESWTRLGGAEPVAISTVTIDEIFVAQEA